jgi:hypothetical protein
MHNAKNMVWILYLIIVYYLTSVQPNKEIFFSNLNDWHTSNKIIAAAKLDRTDHNCVSHCTVANNFQQLSNSTITNKDYIKIKRKNTFFDK